MIRGYSADRATWPITVAGSGPRYIAAHHFRNLLAQSITMKVNAYPVIGELLLQYRTGDAFLGV